MMARVLRAVIQHQASATPPAELLNVVDRRTLSKMLLDAGGTSSELPRNVQEFLDRQRFITNAGALDVLRTALARAGFLPDSSSNDLSRVWSSTESTGRSYTRARVDFTIEAKTDRLEREDVSTRDVNDSVSSASAMSAKVVK